MTGISKAEKVILLITVAFFLFTIGWFIRHTSQPGEYQVTTLKQEQVITPIGEVDDDDWPDSLLEGERININMAQAKDLKRLPGIGAKRAQEIVDYREKYGGFQSIEELSRISGIGAATLDSLRPYVSVG